MASDDPLQGVAANWSEETRTVVSCIMVRMMQVVRKLLSRPQHAPASQEDLDALLLEETVATIAGSGPKPQPPSRDPRLSSLPPADQPRHDGGSR